MSTTVTARGLAVRDLEMAVRNPREGIWLLRDSLEVAVASQAHYQQPWLSGSLPAIAGCLNESGNHS